MNIVSALISTVIFGTIFATLTYLLARQKGHADALSASVRSALIASVLFFLAMLILQQTGYA